MTGMIASGLKFRTVYENSTGEKRLVLSVTNSVVIWKTADPDLPAGAKSQGSATLKSFLRWKTSEHEATDSELKAFDKITRWREYAKQDSRRVNAIKSRILKQRISKNVEVK